MNYVSGSVGKTTRKQLTPFERAEYNVAQFAINVQLGERFQELIQQLELLEQLKNELELANDLISLKESPILDLRHKVIADEIEAIEEAIMAYCALQDISTEA